MEVIAASWHGAIKVTLTRQPDTDVPHASVWLTSWRGMGDTRCVYQGTLSDFGRNVADLQTLVNQMAENLRKVRPALQSSPGNVRTQWHCDVQAIADALEAQGAFVNHRTDFLAACGALEA